MPTLLNTAVFYLLVAEVVILLLMLLPMPGGIRKSILRSIGASRVLASLKQPFAQAMIVVAAMFAMSLRDMLRNQELWDERKAAERSLHGHGSLLEVKLVRSQRNMYLSFFALLLMLVIYRLYEMLKYMDELRSDNADLKSRAPAATTMAN